MTTGLDSSLSPIHRISAAKLISEGTGRACVWETGIWALGLWALAPGQARLSTRPDARQRAKSAVVWGRKRQTNGRCWEIRDGWMGRRSVLLMDDKMTWGSGVPDGGIRGCCGAPPAFFSGHG
jgi:hypothetical protein